jgi:hypothetical protein
VVAFATSFLVTLLALVPLPFIAKRRPPGTPVTWGEALVAATYVYFLLWFALGVVPHFWLTYAGNELNWRTDSIVWGPANLLRPRTMGGWLPVVINYQAIRDIVVVIIYVFYLGLIIAVWAMWQGRGKRAEQAEIETTAYGRPLVKKGS